MNLLAFLAFFLGVISILITLQYVKTCDASKLLAKAYQTTERMSDGDKLLAELQDKAGIEDSTVFFERMRRPDTQTKWIELVKG
jgi:hypothetical protein